MRITAGTLKGRAVECLADNIRPTASRARETLFNILSHADFNGFSGIEGAVVLDLCCGSGLLGFEALSRGATKLVGMDVASTSLSVAKKNAANLGVEKSCLWIKGDALNPPSNNGIIVDLVLADPPYGKISGFTAFQQLQQGGWLKETALLVLETSSKKPEVLESLQDSLEIVKTREVGAALFYFCSVKKSV
ncbi:MAG: RsmD family RNA methyltransferase [Alphaproteobacteria bacterium]